MENIIGCVEGKPENYIYIDVSNDFNDNQPLLINLIHDGLAGLCAAAIFSWWNNKNEGNL